MESLTMLVTGVSLLCIFQELGRFRPRYRDQCKQITQLYKAVLVMHVNKNSLTSQF